jgi:ATP-dependent Clp protease ATP-binding subunit ClpA
MSKHLTTEGRDVVVAALAEARRRGENRIGTEHLLLGTLADPAGVGTQALGVDLPAARAALVRYDGEGLAALGFDPALAILGEDDVLRRRPRGRVTMTEGATRVFHDAIRDAKKRGETPLDVRQLLLVLLQRGPTDPATNVLRLLGVDRDEARQRLVPVSTA